MSKYGPESPKVRPIYITSDHITYIDTPLKGEVDTDRLWFIKSLYPLNDYEWSVARNLSLYWYYQSRLGCTYSSNIERAYGGRRPPN